MPLEKLNNFSFNHSDQPDALYETMSALEVKENFDSRAEEVRIKLNSLIDQLQRIADGDSGANSVKITSIEGITGDDIQSALESLKALSDNLQSQIVNNDTDIGNLQTLKANISDVYNKTQLFTKTDLQSNTAGSSGANKVGTSPITGVSGTTVQDMLSSLKNLINQTVLGQIPDGSITKTKLAFSPADETDLVSHKADDTAHVKYGVATGAANIYAVTLNPAPTSYVEGMAVSVKINVASSGASTLNINGLGAKGIKKSNGSDVTNLKANGIYTFRYDGTSFILQGEGASGNATASDLLSGKTATTDAGEITGSMANRSGTSQHATSILSSVANRLYFYPPQGYYDGSTGVYEDEYNFLEANIRQGITMFGKTGTLAEGKKFASGTGYTNSGNEITVTGLSFQPRTIVFYMYKSTSNLYYMTFVHTAEMTHYHSDTAKIAWFNRDGSTVGGYPYVALSLNSEGFYVDFGNWSHLNTASVKWIAFE
jgi:hypothetical protein